MTIREVKKKLFQRLHEIWTGGYPPKYSVLAGFLLAWFVAFIGYIIARSSPRIFTIQDLGVDFIQVWILHATIISLPLIGLSFAWNSVRNLPVSEEILKEYTTRLRSIETVTSLLISNLIIGILVFFNESIPFTALEMSYMTLSILVFSVLLTIRRFQIVLDLMLYKTVDNKVKDFAKESISNKYSVPKEDNVHYIEHFVQKAHKLIQDGDSEVLEHNLKHIEEIFWNLLTKDSSSNYELHDYLLEHYLSLHKECVKCKDDDCEVKIIVYIRRYFGYCDKNDGFEGVSILIDSFRQFLRQHFSYHDNKGQNLKLFLGLFSNIQTFVIDVHKDSTDERGVSETSKLLDTLLISHSELWQIAIEYECFEVIKGLHSFKKDLESDCNPYFFEYNEKEQNEFSLIKGKKLKKYKEVYPEIKKMAFYPYGWGLHLYMEGDISEEFIVKLFNEYVKNDFKSVKDLTNIFFDISLADPLCVFWERKSTNRKLGDSYEAVFMKMAIDSWIFDFYCTALCWIICKEEDIEDIKKMSGREITIVKDNDYRQCLSDIKKIIEKIRSYRQSNYPLSEFLKEPPTLEERCDVLIEYFIELQTALEKEREKWIRKQPLNQRAIKQYEESVKKALDNSSLRKGLLELSSKKDKESDMISKELKYIFSKTIEPRAFFVEDRKVIRSNFDILENYQRHILSELPVDLKYVDTEVEAFEMLMDFLSDSLGGTTIVNLNLKVSFRKNDNFEFDITKNVHTFNGVKVLFEKTNLYYAVYLDADSIEYLEKNKDHTFRTKITPGENVIDQKFIDEYKDSTIEDYVLCEVSIDAMLKVKENVGVIITRKVTDYNGGSLVEENG